MLCVNDIKHLLPSSLLLFPEASWGGLTIDIMTYIYDLTLNCDSSFHLRFAILWSGLICIFSSLWTCVGSAFTLLAMIWELVFIMNSLSLNLFFSMNQFSLFLALFLLSPKLFVYLHTFQLSSCFWLFILILGSLNVKIINFDTKLAPLKWHTSSSMQAN